MIHDPKRRGLPESRRAATKMVGVPTIGQRVAQALREREELTADEEAIADTQIAAAMQALRERHIANGKRSVDLAKEHHDDEADDVW